MHGHFVKGRTTRTTAAMTAAANGTPNEALSNLSSSGASEPGLAGSASLSKLNFFVVVFRPFKLSRLPTATDCELFRSPFLSRAAGEYFSEMRSSPSPRVAEWSGVWSGGSDDAGGG